MQPRPLHCRERLLGSKPHAMHEGLKIHRLIMKRTKPVKDTDVPTYTLYQLRRMLSRKMKRFIQEYCSNGWNMSQAARDAGYSKRSAGQIGSELLKKPESRQYHAEIKEEYE